MPIRLVSQIALVCLMSLASTANAVSITTDALIDVGDTTYDGQDITVSNCTLTVNGAHTFAGLQAVNNAVVTHTAATPSQTYSLALTVTNGVTVDASSRIDATGRGFLPGYTLGNTTTGGTTGAAGGSYGGLGLNESYSGGISNGAYGDYHDPNELGSGGGYGGSGGGLVRITANTLQVDGTIAANGVPGDRGGGGSGGAIRLDVGTLGGAGTITANGGDGPGGYGSQAGGGGRVAIYYQTVNGLDLITRVTAHGGATPSPASVGTIFLQPAGGSGQLRIDGHGVPVGLWTPVGQTSDTMIAVDELVVSGTNVVAAPAHEMPINVGSVSVVNGGDLTHRAATTTETYSLQMTVSGSVTVDASSRIDVTGRGFLPGYTLGNTTTGGTTGAAGGSYGGLGLGESYSGGTSNVVYGDYHDPNELGSGGGYGGSGGGLVRITANTLQVDGTIAANGLSGDRGGGGSGGAIRLDLGTLGGAGAITANGGDGPGGYGSQAAGGGRVAIYYQTANGFDLLTRLTAHGGATPSPASVGTIFLQPAGGPGQLRIDGHGVAAGLWTPLGQAADTMVAVDELVISGTNVVAAPAHEMPIHVANVSVVNGGDLTHRGTTTDQTYSLQMTVTGNLLVDATSTIDVSGAGYLPGHTLGNTTVGGATGAAGASYGGLGVADTYNGGSPNAVYGDEDDPVDLGSGGGPAGGGGSGGGLVRIGACNGQIDGTILANGVTPGRGGGGSGGGIWLNVGTLSGAGEIAANGSDGPGGYGSQAGGGGRIAIYTLTGTTPPGIQVASNGGTIPTPAQAGSIHVGSTVVSPCPGLNLPPVAMCRNVTKSADATCKATVLPTEVDDGSSDPDGSITSRVLGPAGPYALGTTNGTLTVTDNQGASDFCSAMITVRDTTPPTIGCPANVTTNVDAEATSAVATFANPTASDNCGLASVGCSPPSGSTFDLGTNVVACSGMDASGNTAGCTFDVVVTQVQSGPCPDLTGRWLHLAQTCRTSKSHQHCRVKGELIVENIGTANAPTSFVRYYLSNDATFDAGDTQLDQVATGKVKTGKHKKRTLSAKLPAGTTGAGEFILAVLDADHAVAECNESNNVIVFGPVQ